MSGSDIFKNGRKRRAKQSESHPRLGDDSGPAEIDQWRLRRNDANAQELPEGLNGPHSHGQLHRTHAHRLPRRLAIRNRHFNVERGMEAICFLVWFGL